MPKFFYPAARCPRPLFPFPSRVFSGGYRFPPVLIDVATEGSGMTTQPRPVTFYGIVPGIIRCSQSGALGDHKPLATKVSCLIGFFPTTPSFRSAFAYSLARTVEQKGPPPPQFSCFDS